jgi:hypoxanthine phosphoribosyltransferase
LKQKRKLRVRRGTDDGVIVRQGDPARAGQGLDRSRPRTRVRELSWAHFDQMVERLAREIQARYRPDAVVGVAHGGVFLGGALAHALRAEFFPVRITRRSRDQRKSGTKGGKPRLLGEMPRELKGRRVLIVDDVAASGETLELAQRLARDVGSRQVKTASLIQREAGYAPTWTALATDDIVVFPWDYEPVVEDGRFEVDPQKSSF